MRTGTRQPKRADGMAPVEVAALRAKLGLTQEQFAATLGCTSRSVRGWERGEHRPRGLALAALREMERAAGPLQLLEPHLREVVVPT